MRVAWAPLLLGLALTAGGLWMMAQGWGAVQAASADPGALASLGAGALLTLLGLLMVAVPLLVPVLYRIYGPGAFTTRGGACPVVTKCGRCGEFNFRGRADCKGCGQGLVWELPRQAG